MGKILIIEDYLHVREVLKDELAAVGHSVDIAPDLKMATWKLNQGQYDVVIVDLKLPDGNGLSLYDSHRDKLNFKSIIITANATISTAVEAIKKGAFNYLEKPVDPESLLVQVNKILKINRLNQRNHSALVESAVMFSFDHFIYHSRVMEELVTMAKVLAQTDNTILIQGETGCGKEVLAHAIHHASQRRQKTFLPVNCASIPGELFESEFFGFEKGAFTGAIGSYTGRFIQAHNGTLFLDEIGELPLHIQAKLLRILDERTVYRLKSQQAIPVDVKLITATNRDLQKEVQQQTFRSDFYFRLQESRLYIPPLRERVEDIIPLARYFIGIYNDIYNRNITRMSAEVEAFLMNYPWPGNIRELKNMIKSIIPFKQDSLIVMSDLSYSAVNHSDKKEQKVCTLAVCEKKHISKVLDITSFNIQRTAELLGIARSSLYRKMKEYGLTSPD